MSTRRPEPKTAGVLSSRTRVHPGFAASEESCEESYECDDI